MTAGTGKRERRRFLLLVCVAPAVSLAAIAALTAGLTLYLLPGLPGATVLTLAGMIVGALGGMAIARIERRYAYAASVFTGAMVVVGYWSFRLQFVGLEGWPDALSFVFTAAAFPLGTHASLRAQAVRQGASAAGADKRR